MLIFSGCYQARGLCCIRQISRVTTLQGLLCVDAKKFEKHLIRLRFQPIKLDRLVFFTRSFQTWGILKWFKPLHIIVSLQVINSASLPILLAHLKLVKLSCSHLCIIFFFRVFIWLVCLSQIIVLNIVKSWSVFAKKISITLARQFVLLSMDQGLSTDLYLRLEIGWILLGGQISGE